MENPVYKMMINNIKHYLKNSNPLNPETIDAFRFSEIIAISLAKRKEDVLNDIVTDTETNN